MSGEVVVVVPVPACAVVQRMLERACRLEAERSGGGWRPALEVVDLLRVLRRAPLVDAFAEHGFAGETDVEPVRLDWATATEAARVLGVTSQAVTKRCRLGQIPEAVQRSGRWFIPWQVLPEPEEANDDNQAA